MRWESRQIGKQSTPGTAAGSSVRWPQCLPNGQSSSGIGWPEREIKCILLTCNVKNN